MKIQIKNRYTNEVIVEGEYKNIKECLEKNSSANLRSADLRFADLSYANLSSANLSSADLCFAKIKISQKEDLLKAMYIQIEND